MASLQGTLQFMPKTESATPSFTDIERFVSTRSLLLRIVGLSKPLAFSAARLLDNLCGTPPPSLFFVAVAESAEPTGDVWALFETHSDAKHVLSLFLTSSISSPLPAVFPAQDSDFSALPLVRLKPALPPILTDMYSSGEYILSTNPPNPRTTFRMGDWICGSHSCGAHNFGRNSSCIGCGSPRPSQVPSPYTQSDTVYQTASTHLHSNTRAAASPRFSSAPSTPATPASPPTSSHPLLTPSGKAFAKGGKVQNISPDPLVPCIMYWPDNEPLPTRGQIRPNIVVGSQPPILNTGNRGPISHQPGDWICLKCNYLNWRRRRVCQTCYPYAEGNGDSISVAVQAERIALLQNVLAQNRVDTMSAAERQPRAYAQRPQTLTPPEYMYGSSAINVYPAGRQTVQRSQSQHELNAKYSTLSPSNSPQPIYQTPLPPVNSGYHASVNKEQFSDPSIHMPTPLLPSFLQDLVHSPTLSPASTNSSAELSCEDDEISVPSPKWPAKHGTIGQERRVNIKGVDDLTRSMSIWSLDGEEAKSLAGSPLPHHLTFAPFGRFSSRGSSLESLPE